MSPQQPELHRIRRFQSGRIPVPSLPFSEPVELEELLLAYDGVRAVRGPGPQTLRIDCPPETLPVLANQLSGTGVAGYRAEISVSEWQAATLTPQVAADLAAAEVALLRLVRPIDAFTDMDVDGPAWLEFGKAALRYGLPFGWRGVLPEPVQTYATHLTPACDDPERAARWRYAQLYWRRGPAFIVVTDARQESSDRADVRQLTIEPGPLVEIFGNDLDRSISTREMDRSTVDELYAAGLVGLIDDVAVFLPYRARYWPLNRIV